MAVVKTPAQAEKAATAEHLAEAAAVAVLESQTAATAAAAAQAKSESGPGSSSLLKPYPELFTLRTSALRVFGK